MADNVPIPQNIGTLEVVVKDTSGALRNLLISMLMRISTLESEVAALKAKQ